MDLGVIGVIMAGAALAMAVAAAAIAWSVRRLWQKMVKETGKESLDKVLWQLIEYLEAAKNSQKQIREILDKQAKEGEKHFQKIGMVRFNPFSDSGGDQSFSLSLLDGQDNGFVISSLHTRAETRIYLKTVLGGKGEGFELSKEEQQAIRIAK